MSEVLPEGPVLRINAAWTEIASTVSNRNNLAMQIEWLRNETTVPRFGV